MAKNRFYTVLVRRFGSHLEAALLRLQPICRRFFLESALISTKLRKAHLPPSFNNEIYTKVRQTTDTLTIA